MNSNDAINKISIKTSIAILIVHTNGYINIAKAILRVVMIEIN